MQLARHTLSSYDRIILVLHLYVALSHQIHCPAGLGRLYRLTIAKQHTRIDSFRCLYDELDHSDLSLELSISGNAGS